MAKIVRPPAARLLEQRRIEYELVEFDEVLHSAEDVADAIRVDGLLVYKTLVVVPVPTRRRPSLVMIPAGSRLDLKALARATGDRRLSMASHKDAERLTGLKVGGISAIALAGQGFPTYIDRRALSEDHIFVSAGLRGYDVRIAVDDLVRITDATPVLLPRDATGR